MGKSIFGVTCIYTLSWFSLMFETSIIWFLMTNLPCFCFVCQSTPEHERMEKSLQNTHNSRLCPFPPDSGREFRSWWMRGLSRGHERRLCEGFERTTHRRIDRYAARQRQRDAVSDGIRHQSRSALRSERSFYRLQPTHPMAHALPLLMMNELYPHLFTYKVFKMKVISYTHTIHHLQVSLKRNVQSWKWSLGKEQTLEILKSWNLDILVPRQGANATFRFPDSAVRTVLDLQRHHYHKPWNLEILKYWNIEILTSYRSTKASLPRFS